MEVDTVRSDGEGEGAGGYEEKSRALQMEMNRVRSDGEG